MSLIEARLNGNCTFDQAEFSDETLAEIRHELTFKSFGGERFGFGPANIVPLWSVNDKTGTMTVPRRYAVEMLDLPEVLEDVSDGSKADIVFREDLQAKRPELKVRQDALIEEFLRVLGEQKPVAGGIFSMPCGTGKTVVALKMLSKIKRTALVIVHTEFLMDQWIERFREFTSVKPNEIGRVQGDECDYEGKKVVLGMVQSLTKRSYPEEFRKAFGVVVCDECHRMGAPLFNQAIPLFNARIRIGLTATPKRSDGLQPVFEWHIGQVLAKMKGTEVTPKIFQVPFDIWIPEHRYKYKDKVFLGKLVSYLCDSDGRNAWILKEVVKAVRAGRRVMVLSDRREHLSLLKSRFDKELGATATSGFYVGGMKAEERERSSKADALFGCVSDDTSCLTLGGWKRREELRIGELVAAYDQVRKLVEYVPLEDVVSYEHDGQMCQVDRKEVDAVMTWDHRNVALKPYVVAGRKEWREEVLRSHQLTYNCKLRVFAPMLYPAGPGVGEDLAELVGWVIAEGSYPKGCGNLLIYQKVGKHARRIEELLTRLGIAFRRNEYRRGQLSWRVPAKDAARIRSVCPNKKLTEFLVSLPQNEAVALFRGLVNGDGHRKSDGRITFIQKDKSTVDWFTILAWRVGYKPMIGRMVGNTQRVYLNRREFVGLHDRRFHVKTIPFKGTVWCPKTKHGTWVARRNGSMFITGNTFQLAKEGLDIPEIDTLFLTTPHSDVEQPVGRILRFHEDKKEPIVVDIVDSLETCKQFSARRLKQYKKLGYDVQREVT